MTDLDASTSEPLAAGAGAQTNPDTSGDADDSEMSRRALLAAGAVAGAGVTAAVIGSEPAAAAGPLPRVPPWTKLAGKIYKAVSSGTPGDKRRALRLLKKAGMSKREARTLYDVSSSIAQKAGDQKTFIAILKGEMPVPMRLSTQEVQMIGGIGRATKPPGRTWEGSAKKSTWGGSDTFNGHTWEGTSR